VLPLEGGKKPIPFLTTEFDEQAARFSPDGHWVAYVSNESGQPEVYVRSFSMNSAGTAMVASAKWQISDGFAQRPRWRNDGRELYYRSFPDGRLMGVGITTSPTFRAGKPRPLGVVVPPGIGLALTWDSTTDGKRFLVVLPDKGKTEPYTVLLNWQAGLKK